MEFETVRVDRQGVLVAVEKRTAQTACVLLGNGISLELVNIPGGAFLMGSAKGQGYEDEWPEHEVTVGAFALGKYPVTQAEWAAVMGSEALCRFRGPWRPVDCVAWDSAMEFCRQLSGKTGRHFRLPSEAEWEYACRAGSSSPFTYGETLTTDLANYNGEFTYAAEHSGVYRHATTKAGIFPPNAFGLHDMHGNLWEWCADPWHDDYRGAPADGSVWETGGHPWLRVLRGGSWHDIPQVCRCATRLKQVRSSGDDLFGLRVAMQLV